MYSIEELYRTYEKRIFQYFYGLTTNYHSAEELTQETFFQVVRTIPFFREDARVTTWLYKVARNVFSMWKRKKDNYSISLDHETTEVPDQWEPSFIVIAFGAKNTLLVMSVSQFSNEEYAQKILPVITNLGKTIFYDLNGGQQMVFQGEGENWKGKVIYNYYNHFWTDDKGVIRYDGWSHKQPVLEFKGDPSAIYGDFSYEFDSPIGKFGGTSSDGLDPQQFRERDTSASYGGVLLGFGTVGGGGVGTIPQRDSVCTLTLKWNDKQETVVLKATD